MPWLMRSELGRGSYNGSQYDDMGRPVHGDIVFGSAAVSNHDYTSLHRRWKVIRLFTRQDVQNRVWIATFC